MYKEGDEPEEFYIVKFGNFTVKKNDNFFNGKKKLIITLKIDFKIDKKWKSSWEEAFWRMKY